MVLLISSTFRCSGVSHNNWSLFHQPGVSTRTIFLPCMFPSIFTHCVLIWSELCLTFEKECATLLLPLWNPPNNTNRSSEKEKQGEDDKINNKKWSDMWPSMVTYTWNLCSAFNPSKCTHTPWTHTLCSGQPMLRRPGSSWGFSALLKGLTSVVVLRVLRVQVIHSPHRQFLPDMRLEPETFGLQVRLSIH